MSSGDALVRVEGLRKWFAVQQGFIANLLAGPLVDLAPSFAQAIAPGGQLLTSPSLQDRPILVI